ncbi:MAG: HU family DNA-binding protein [Clostridia bacterium]|jgi:DNA-binding protein HU-beta|nr:HU family DNA-binding protein [Clostridia bacterium]
MNKGELIAALAAKTEKTKKESEAALNGILDVIAESMAKGEKVQLIGFGTFEAKSRPARVARNPRTGESVKIAACKAPAFKAGKALKDAVNK